MITIDDAKVLVEIARASIKGVSFTGKIPKNLEEEKGVFVTLEKYPSGNLRGCIGHIQADKKLFEVVRTTAYSAAYEDVRFSPVEKGEVDNLTVEISILSKPEKSNFKDIKPGKDGVIIKTGFSSALFLPQVWEKLPDKNEFFDALCAKAGHLPGCWEKKETEILKFEVIAFKEKEPNGPIEKVEI